MLSWGSRTVHSGEEYQKWPHGGPSGYNTPTVWASPTPHSGKDNPTLPTGGPSGYLTLAVLGVPSSSGRGGIFEVRGYVAIPPTNGRV